MRDTISEYWWAFVLRGVVAVLFGIGAFAWPDITLQVLVIFFGAHCLVQGIVSIIAAFRSERWGLYLLYGLVSVAAGVLTFIWPGITALSLILIIGIWAIMGGVSEIVGAIQLRKEIENEWLLGLSGAASVLFGLIVVFKPGAGALALIWLIAFYAVFVGVLMIGLGIRLHGLKKSRPREAGATA